MYPASQPSDDPLRARAFEFWKHQFLPELTQSTVASETEKREGEEEQTSVVVYASAAALEVIKWSCPGGVATLYDAGVSSVKCLDEVFELQTNQVLDEIRLEDPSTVHILIATHLSHYEQQLRSLFVSGRYQTVHLWYGLPDDIQHPPSKETVEGETMDDNLSILDRWKDRLSYWHTMNAMHGKSLDIIQHYAPALLWACVGRRFYVMPASTSVFPPLAVLVEDITAPVSNYYTEEQKQGLRDLGAQLAIILEELHYRGEFFVIGESAKYVARQCHRYASYAAAAAGKRAELSNAAVVIMDRTMDLVAPCWHHDNLLDQIYRVLARRNIHDGSLDLTISATCLASSLEPKDVFPDKLCSVAHGLNEEAFQLFDSMGMSGQKDGLVLVRKVVSDVITFENINAKIPRSMGRVTPALLNKLLSAFKDEKEQKIKHATLVELTAAVIQTLQESPKAMWDEMVALEKTVLFSIADKQQLTEHLQGAVPKVNEAGVVASRMRKNFTLKDAMLLALGAYSLGGEELMLSEELEMILFDRWFAAALAGNRSILDAASKEGDVVFKALEILQHSDKEASDIDEEEKNRLLRERRLHIEAWLECVRGRFHSVARTRNRLKALRGLLRESSLLPYVPFIQQLLEEMYATPSNDNLVGEDLEHIPPGGTLGSYLTGFSRFLSSTKPHPGHYRQLVLCVVGGITFNEVKTIRELTANENVQVVIISTDIATGNTIFKHVFCTPSK